MDHPEGSVSQRADRVDVDRRVRLEFRGTLLSSDGGLLVTRGLNNVLGLSDRASASLDVAVGDLPSPTLQARFYPMHIVTTLCH